MESVKIVPTKQDTQDAIAVLPQIELISKQSATIEVGSFQIRYDGGVLLVPPGVVMLLTGAIKAMAAGKTMQFSEVDSEVSTQEAAEILNVSRPYVAKLFDAGQIPGKMVGNQRRMFRKDVEIYHKKIRAARVESMIEYQRLSEELEAGDV